MFSCSSTWTHSSSCTALMYPLGICCSVCVSKAFTEKLLLSCSWGKKELKAEGEQLRLILHSLQSLRLQVVIPHDLFRNIFGCFLSFSFLFFFFFFGTFMFPLVSFFTEMSRRAGEERWWWNKWKNERKNANAFSIVDPLCAAGSLPQALSVVLGIAI